jgi:hypothetical protein
VELRPTPSFDFSLVSHLSSPFADRRRSRCLSFTESISRVVVVVVVASGTMTRAMPRSAVSDGGSIPPASCVISAVLSLRPSPSEHHNRCLESVSQGKKKWKDDVSAGVETEAGSVSECSVDLLRVPAVTVTAVSGESLAALDVEEEVPPVKEVCPPDPDTVRQECRPLSGTLVRALTEKWRTLCMGGKKKVDGKSTGTVAAYTALFLSYLRALTAHDVQSSDIHVIGRYVEGIKRGHEALYRVMLGDRKMLWCETLEEAINAAEMAEVTLKVSRTNNSSPASKTFQNRKGGVSGQSEEDEEKDTDFVCPPPLLPPLTFNTEVDRNGFVSREPLPGEQMELQRVSDTELPVIVTVSPCVEEEIEERQEKEAGVSEGRVEEKVETEVVKECFECGGESVKLEEWSVDGSSADEMEWSMGRMPIDKELGRLAMKGEECQLVWMLNSPHEGRDCSCCMCEVGREGECLQPHFPGDRLRRISGGALRSFPCPPRLVFSVTGAVGVDKSLELLDVDINAMSQWKVLFHDQNRCDSPRQSAIPNEVIITTGRICSVSSQLTAVDEQLEGEVHSMSFVIVTGATETEASCPRLPLRCSALTCAEFENLMADGSTPRLLGHILVDGPVRLVRTVSAETAHGALVLVPVLDHLGLSASCESCVTVAHIVSARIYVPLDCPEDVVSVHRYDVVVGNVDDRKRYTLSVKVCRTQVNRHTSIPGVDIVCSDSDVEAITSLRAGRREEWNRPSSTEVAGTASLTVVWIEAEGYGKSVSKGQAGAVDRVPVGDGDRLLSNSGGALRLIGPVSRASRVFQVVVAVCSHKTRTTTGQTCSASSQLTAAEECVWPMNEVNRVLAFQLPSCTCGDIQQEGGMKEEANCRSCASVSTVVFAVNMQCPTAVVTVVVLLSTCDGSSVTVTQRSASKPQLDRDRWSCGDRGVGYAGYTASRLRPRAVGGAHGDAAMDALTWKFGDLQSFREVDLKDLVFLPTSVIEEGAPLTRGEEQRCAPEELRRCMGRAIVAYSDAAGTIEDSCSERCSQMVVVVRKAQCAVCKDKPFADGAYRRPECHARRKKDVALPGPGDVAAAAVLVQQRSVNATAFSQVDLDVEGSYATQIDIDPKCREYLAISHSVGMMQKEGRVISSSIAATAPAISQWLLQRISKEVRLNVSVMERVADLLVSHRYAQAEQRGDYVEWVLRQRRMTGDYASPARCELQSQVDVLGRAIGVGGEAMQQLDVDTESMRKRPRLQSVCVLDVCRYLGLNGLYHCLVAVFVSIVGSLLVLTTKATSFVREGLEGWDHPSSVSAASVVVARCNPRRKTLVLPGSCSGMQVGLSQLTAAKMGEPTWTAPSAGDVDVDFEWRSGRRWVPHCCDAMSGGEVCVKLPSVTVEVVGSCVRSWVERVVVVGSYVRSWVEQAAAFLSWVSVVMLCLGES